MEFGEQDTVRMCRQYREALRRQRDEPYTLLSERLARASSPVRGDAAIDAQANSGRDRSAARDSHGRRLPWSGSRTRSTLTGKCRSSRRTVW